MKTLKKIFYVMLALLAVITAYLPGLHSGFLFDDYPHIVDNTALEIPKLTITDLYHASLSSNAGPLKRPVAMFTLAINHYVSGLNPFGYIVTNILIHLIAALGLFILAYLISREFGKDFTETVSPFHFALLSMLAWGLHPYNLTGVLYIIQRMTSLAGLFSILALAVFAFCRPRLGKTHHYLFLMGAGIIACGLLAIFSKESALLLPIQIAVLEFTIFSRVSGTPNYWLRLRKWLLIIGIAAIAILSIQKLMMTDWVASYLGRGFSLEERLLTELRIMVIYLRQIIFPDITSMGLFMDDLPISTSLLSPLSTGTALILHVALILAAFRYRTQQPVFSFAVLWFYGSHLLESTVFPLELMFEHRNYLAMIGPIIAIVYYVLAAARTRRQRKIAFGFLYGFIALLGISTAVRASYFGDPVAYALYEAEHHPGSSRANFYAGRTMSQLMLWDKENKDFYFQKAVNFYQKAEQANNQTIEPLIAESQTYLAAKKPVDPTLIISLQEKLSSAPPGNNGYYIAKGLLEIGRIGYPNKISKEQLDKIFTSALSNPKLQGDNRGHILIAYGMTYCNYYNMCDKAIPMLEQAVKTAPTYTEFKVILASFYGIVGDKANAQKWTVIAEKEDRLKYFSDQTQALKSGAVITWGPQLANHY